MLASDAKRIFAIDNCKEAILYARQYYSDDKIEFLLSNALKSSFDNDAMDIVICFEMIEHIDQPDLLLTEIKRVLKKDGTLILSTPNKRITSPTTEKSLNPYHKKEYTFLELKELLQKYFSQVQFYGEFPNPEMKKNVF
jgi:2-polyprenyl-3-methyl-5-hydroxy-6-metoxy-1,4-benzoquinol methylase